MLSYIIRRLLLLLPTLIGITAIVFLTIALSPGGIGASLLSAQGSMKPAERKVRMDYLNRRYGLDRPYIVQYLSWLNKVSPVGGKEAGEGFPASWKFGFKSPDLGESFTRGRKVSEIILEALPVSIILQVISIPVTYIIAVLSGIYAARHRGKMVDVGIGTTLIGMYSVPEIWVGVLFIGFLCNNDYVRWFPTNNLHDMQADSMHFLPHFSGGFQRGWLLDVAWHLVGPVVCISYANFAIISKLARGALLDTLGLDFVRTARAKGLSERVVLFRHAFRNSLIPLITVAASILPALVSGALIVETIFGLPGMGKLSFDAIESRDRELLLSDTFVISVLTLLGYLLADIGYAIADPRVSYDS
ncbi:MAG TPA: ABC transporter permease [Tepidisphaeraceae bacterium]|nr:ABC transporter permease [Tepidisphaeraceae bacterium]